jgi:menaquinone-dependent protoporphyrinogen oxidase
MHVLVSAASKHGSTQEIAERLGQTLRAAGLGVDVRAPGEVTGLGDYDAAVLGSAVYAGHWMKPMLELAEREAPALRELRVWLFSSGPIGTPDAKPEGDPVDVAGVLESTGAEAHSVFAGKLDRDALSFPERAIVKALRAPFGDFRDWEAIDAFARGIAAAVSPQGLHPAS